MNSKNTENCQKTRKIQKMRKRELFTQSLQSNRLVQSSLPVTEYSDFTFEWINKNDDQLFIYFSSLIQSQLVNYTEKDLQFYRTNNQFQFGVLNGQITTNNVVPAFFAAIITKVELDEIEIVGLATSEKFKRFGFGSFLVSKIVKDKAIRVKADVAAVPFYKKLGFAFENNKSQLLEPFDFSPGEVSMKRLVFKTELKILEESQKTFLFANRMIAVIKDLLNDKSKTDKKVLRSLLKKIKKTIEVTNFVSIREMVELIEASNIDLLISKI